MVAIATTIALFAAEPAIAAPITFIVNSKGNEDDAGLNGDCDVDPTADDDCTLRAAIQEANAHAGQDGIAFNKTDNGSDPDDVAFETGASAASVTIAGALPTITRGVTIGAGDCHDFDPFDPKPPPTPCAVLSLSSALQVDSVGEVLLSGFAFSGAGIDVVSVTGASPTVADFTLHNTWFGIDTLGAKAIPPITSLLLERGVDGADIGGSQYGAANLFARQSTGIDIVGADHTMIRQNSFGVLPDGSFARAGEGASNNGDNIKVNGDSVPNPDDPAQGTLIGQSSTFDLSTPACDGSCNLIAAAGMSATNIPQSRSGINLGSEAQGTIIRGNQIGSSAGGLGIKGFNNVGIAIGASDDTQIGGPALDADRNVVSGNEITGLAGSDNLLLQGNYLGLDATGTALAADGFATMVSLAGSGSVLDNHILSTGIFPALLLTGSTGAGFVVRGNVFGEGVDGNPLFVGTPVISVTGSGHTIGGTGPDDGNLISDRTVFPNAPNSVGIRISGDGNTVLGNRIGVGSAGDARPLIDGIELSGDADGNLIGGSSAAAENLISNSTGDAIQIASSTSAGNEIDRNRGTANGDLFIDLGADGLGNTLGVNGGALPPAIALAGPAFVKGTAAAGETVRVFDKATAAAGEVELFLGQATADGSGNWQLVYDQAATPAVLPLPNAKGVVATQTDLSANTSELSAVAVTDGDPPETTFKKKPPKTTTDRTPTFKFHSDESGSKFRCKLDTKRYKKCASPKTLAKLSFGRHTFRVKATDTAGNTDLTPAKRRFKVIH